MFIEQRLERSVFRSIPCGIGAVAEDGRRVAVQ